MEARLLIIIGVIFGIGFILIISLNELSDIKKQECKADGGVVIGPFSCVLSRADYSDPLTRDNEEQDVATMNPNELDSELKIGTTETYSENETPLLQIKVVGETQVRRGTTHTIEIQVIRGLIPIEGARVFLDIEDYGENIIKEFKGYTDSRGYLVFSWEIPQSFDDVETLFVIIDVTDGISSKTELFKFQVYCLAGEENCKVKGN